MMEDMNGRIRSLFDEAVEIELPKERGVVTVAIVFGENICTEGEGVANDEG